MFDDTETLRGLFSKANERVFVDYRLDLRDMRDLHTGAPIGFFEESVFHIALIDEGVLDDSDDGEVLSIESLADALLVRSLASARPSPALNRPTTQTLKRLLESQPIVVCAYLLNRYKLRDWRKLNHRDDSWFDDMLHRVKVWEKLERLASDPDSDKVEATLRALAHWLLELDSKCNLHELNPVPGWFEAFHGIESLEQFDLFVQEFAFIATPHLKRADELATIGNRMASSAYVKSWFDQPALTQRKVEIANRKRQHLHDKYGDVKIGLLIEEERLENLKVKREAKVKADSRVIKGRSSRSKAAKLVNKHADVLNNLFKTLGEVTVGDDLRAQGKLPTRTAGTGLPKLVKG